MKPSTLFGTDTASVHTHYSLVVGAVLAMCLAAPVLHLKWSLYLGISLLLILIVHHAIKPPLLFLSTWLLGIATFICFLIEGIPL